MSRIFKEVFEEIISECSIRYDFDVFKKGRKSPTVYYKMTIQVVLNEYRSQLGIKQADIAMATGMKKHASICHASNNIMPNKIKLGGDYYQEYLFWKSQIGIMISKFTHPKEQRFQNLNLEKGAFLAGKNGKSWEEWCLKMRKNPNYYL